MSQEGERGEFLPKTRSIAVWDTTPGRMPIYYTNAPVGGSHFNADDVLGRFIYG